MLQAINQLRDPLAVRGQVVAVGFPAAGGFEVEGFLLLERSRETAALPMPPELQSDAPAQSRDWSGLASHV